MRPGKDMRYRSLLVLLAAGLSACAGVTAVTPEAAAPKHVVQKNFTVGELKTVPVGETMLSLKDYYQKDQQDTWSIGQPVSLRVGLGSMVVIPGDYPVVVRVKVDGADYDVVDVKVHPYELTTFGPSSAVVPMTFLIDQSGRIAKSGAGLGITTDVSGLEPADFRATRAEKTAIDSSRGYTNFELLYSGVAAGALRLTFREYSPNDLSRPATFQDLTYNAAEKSIRFKNVQLDIESADNQAIRFRVKSVPQEWAGAGQP
jgi:hypothetical protein